MDFQWAFVGVAAGGGAGIAFDGAFTTTSASSPVTSSSRTCTAGGTIEFYQVTTDDGTPQYNKNSGGWNNIVEGATLAIASGDTLQIRAALGTVSQQATVFMRAVGGPIIETAVLARS